MGVLKERRVSLGMEIRDIANVTRIKTSYLKAIEEEGFERLPVEIYAKGYIREYAKFLGIAADVAIAPYETYLEEKKKERKRYANKDSLEKFHRDSLTGEVETTLHVTRHDDFRESSKRLLNGHIPSVKNIHPGVLLAASVFIVSVVVFLFIARGKDAPTVSQETEQRVAQGVPDAVRQENTEEKSKAAFERRHNLEIIATDRTWVKVVIDNDDVRDMILNRDEKVSYDVNQSISIVIGNAAGAKLRFDGEEFENLGNKGQVIRMIFPLALNEKEIITRKANKLPGTTPHNPSASPAF